MHPKRGIPSPACGQERAQGWGGLKRWLHASCLFKERCVLISCGPSRPPGSVRGDTSRPLPGEGGDADILALSRPSGPDVRALEATPVRDRRGGFEGVASGTVANSAALGWGQLAWLGRPAPEPSACCPAAPTEAREPRRPLPGAKRRNPSPRRLSLAPPLLPQFDAALGKQSALYKCWSNFPFILCSIHSLILPSFSFDFSPPLLAPLFIVYGLRLSSARLPAFPPLCTRYLLSRSCLSVALSLPSGPCGSPPSLCRVPLSLPLSPFPPPVLSGLPAHLHLELGRPLPVPSSALPGLPGPLGT